MRAILWFKLTAWTLFALAGPVCFLLMRNYLGVAVTGAIGVVIGLFVFGPPSALPLRRELRTVLVAQGLALGGYGTWMSTRPIDPWTHVAGRTRVSLALDPSSGVVHAAEFTEHDAGYFVGDATGWRREPLPARLVYRIALAPDGTTLAHEDRAPILWRRNRDGAWQDGPGERTTPIYAAGARAVLSTRDGSIVRRGGGADPGEPIAGPTNVSALCALDDRVLAVAGVRDDAAARAWTSIDAGATFTALAIDPDAHADLCGISRDGSLWIAAEGTFSADLWVGSADGGFAGRELPAPRIEALAVDPAHGSHAWVGTWGAGVYRSDDGGETWASMGLVGCEVSALVVDFAHGLAYAGTGSGVLVRSIASP